MGGLPPLPSRECWQRVPAGSFISWETRRSFPHQDMAFASWASSAGTFLDGVFLALSKWLLAGLAVLLFYGRMRLSTYLEGNVLYFVILLMVLPAFQWMLNPMFVQNVVFSVGLSLVGGIEIVSAACLLYWIASFIQKKRRRETKL